MSTEESATIEGTPGLFEHRSWGWSDAVALLVWTAAIAAFFWDAVSLRGALFYFDITEINYPYRAFFAEELRAGRFSRWCPGLYCGMPLFSESQAGYLHPLKYLLYPWMATWKAFNLDTVLSIWLTGLGTYLWLRRHVGATAALTGAAIFGLSGFTWAHVIHTSMINALASVPFVIWGLEYSWSGRRWRGVVLGAIALAFQAFAGHLQDTLLTAGLLGLYGLYRAATESSWPGRLLAIKMAVTLAALGILLSAVQWVPSKELLDRSPRAEGLSWGDLTYGSWHPELLPTMVVREAYGTRARDTDWMDGFYPYHEMNTYLGLIALVLAVVGAGGKQAQDRWVAFWVLLVGLALVLMLGRFTFLFDHAHRIPILGSSREPVRFHLWAALAVAALAAAGVERLSRNAGVSLRGGLMLGLALIVLSIPILGYLYAPAWFESKRWTPRNLDQFRWLGRELLIATGRTVVLSALGFLAASMAIRSAEPLRRARWLALLPLLVIADLLGSHWFDVPTVDPRYWTEAPGSIERLEADEGLIRVFGKGDKSAAEPGYVSERIDFLSVRDPLDWSSAAVWKIPTAKGETPIIPQRYVDFTDHARSNRGGFDIMSVTHVLTGRYLKGKILPAQCDLRVISSAKDVSDIPAGGKDLIIVAVVDRVLHFRMFDSDGKMVLDTDEKRFPQKAGQIEDLNKQLAGLWPPHELVECEKARVINAVTSIVGRTIPVPTVPVGSAFIHHNRRALPRARLAGRPLYAKDQAEAVSFIDRLTLADQLCERLIVEDPTRPLPEDAVVAGSARIAGELPERMVVETEAAMPCYLVVSDSYDPGWSATVDGQPATIRAAYSAFRAVYLSGGKHEIVFRYSPAGFGLGLSISVCGILLGLALWFVPRRAASLAADHIVLGWHNRWRLSWFGALGAIVLVSIIGIGPDGRPTIQDRWRNSFHPFTWDSGFLAMHRRDGQQADAQRPARARPALNEQ